MDSLDRVIGDWVQFHTFEDDCKYPLISPSNVVMEDLQLRIEALQLGKSPQEIAAVAKERYNALPWCKGKEKRLRRRDNEFGANHASSESTTSINTA